MLKFDETTHTYEEDGKKLISVTQLLERVGIAESLDGVNREVLKAAAERGTLIHGEIHRYLTSGETGFSAELESFIGWLAESGYEAVESEGMVNDDVVAGTFDLLLRNKGTGEYAIADFKTTSEPHLETTSYQTSIYAYLYEKESLGEVTVPKVFMLWFDHDGNLTPIPLFRQPNGKIEKVIDCYLKGERFSESDMAVDSVSGYIQSIGEVENILANFKALQERYEKRKQEIIPKLIEAMEKSGTYLFDGRDVRIAYVKPGKRTTFDSKRFKAEQPEVYKQYEKTSETKASLRITLKKKEDGSNE